MDLEQLALNALQQVRPNGVGVESYPQVVAMIVNLVALELTKEQEKEGGG